MKTNNHHIYCADIAMARLEFAQMGFSSAVIPLLMHWEGNCAPVWACAKGDMVGPFLSVFACVDLPSSMEQVISA